MLRGAGWRYGNWRAAANPGQTSAVALRRALALDEQERRRWGSRNRAVEPALVVQLEHQFQLLPRFGIRGHSPKPVLAEPGSKLAIAQNQYGPRLQRAGQFESGQYVCEHSDFSLGRFAAHRFAGGVAGNHRWRAEQLVVSVH